MRVTRVYLCVRNFDRKLSYLGGSCPIVILYEGAYGASIGDVIDEAT